MIDFRVFFCKKRDTFFVKKHCMVVTHVCLQLYIYFTIWNNFGFFRKSMDFKKSF